jgi:hypothetical protein
MSYDYDEHVVLITEGEYKECFGIFKTNISFTGWSGLVCGIQTDFGLVKLPWNYFEFVETVIQEMWLREEANQTFASV